MIADQLLAALTPVGAAADDPAYASRFAALLEASRESGKVPLAAYDIDYMIDLHHQGAYSAIGDEWVSGSILHLTSPNADPDLVERSKRLGVIVYDAVDSTGWALLGKYAGGSAETISRNGLAVEYDIATLLFEMRGMSDHSNEGSVLGARSSGPQQRIPDQADRDHPRNGDPGAGRRIDRCGGHLPLGYPPHPGVEPRRVTS